MPANDRWDTDDVLAGIGRPSYDILEAAPGILITHSASGIRGHIAGFNEGQAVILIDAMGGRHEFRPHDGAFVHEGTRVALRRPSAPPPAAHRITRSGSIATRRTRARVARSDRIWVEGLHDAELIEKVWGDDLREEGIVVEPLHGADDLAAAIAGFAPGPGRRLGILLDHLVRGTKESRLAMAADVYPDVMVTGHPYVDVWEAIRPEAIGIAAWPTVPPGAPWKEGVVAALGLRAAPAEFWAAVLDKVSSYTDLATPLVNAVEQLIDFATGA